MQMMPFLKLPLAALFGLGLMVLIGAPALEAKPRQPGYTYITVESRYYAGSTITAPVRQGPRGPEVRLPGGLWFRCELNCYETLRRESIDFWETIREEGGGRD